MDSGRFRRSLIALAAAYALVLQALLAAAVVPVPAFALPGAPAILCSGHAVPADAPADPADPARASCLACCSALTQPLAAPPPSGVVPEPIALPRLPRALAASVRSPARAVFDAAHPPRAPPRA